MRTVQLEQINNSVDCLSGELMRKIIDEIEKQLILSGMQKDNINLLNWKYIKNNRAGLNRLLAEIIIMPGYRSHVKPPIIRTFKNARKRINLIRGKAIELSRKKNNAGIKSTAEDKIVLRRNRFIPANSEQGERKISALWELGLKQAHENIIRLISNYRPAI